MSFPAARVGDMHICPMVTPGVPPVPHVGGPLLPPGVPTVLIGGMPAAVVGNMCTCVGPPDSVVKGSMTVFIGGRPAARMGDITAHGGTIVMGCMTVLIGDMSGSSSAINAKIVATGKPANISDLWEGIDAKMYPISNKAFKEEVLPALNEAEKLLDKKIEQLEKWDATEKELFRRAFGKHDKEEEEAAKNEKLAQIKKMKALFKELKEGKEKKFKFGKLYDKDGNELLGYFAWVQRADTSHTVKLGEAYNKAPLTGYNSKAGTLIHELSHFNDVAGTHDEIYDGEKAYGIDKATTLAKQAPEQAIKNADNFEYYLENSFKAEEPSLTEKMFKKIDAMWDALFE